MRTISLSLLLMLLAAPAFAHAVLQTPVPRSPDDDIKTGPCGGVGQTTPQVFEPGQTIDIMWLETIDHPGSYRISISPDGSDSFDDAANVIVAEHPDMQLGASRTNPTQYMAEVTLPDTECEGCVLQLRQFMDGSAQPYYYSCADIAIRSAASGDPAEEPSPTDPLGGTDAAPTAEEEATLGANPGFCSVTAGDAARTTGYSTGVVLIVAGFMLIGAGRRRLANQSS